MLKNKVFSAVGWIGIAQIWKASIQFVALLVLSRLIGPEAYGFYAFCLAIYTLASKFAEVSIPTIIIQQDNLGANNINSLKVVVRNFSLIAASVFFIVSLLFAPERFSEIVPLILLMAVSLAIIPYYSIPDALMRRDLNYSLSIFADIISLTLSIIIAIIVAANEAPLLALGLLTIGYTIIKILIYRVMYLPRVYPIHADKKYLKSAMQITLSSLIGHVAMSVPTLFLGAAGQVYQTGLFSRANSVATLVTNQIINPSSVLLQSYLSRRQRQEGKFQEAIIIHIDLALHITTPVLATIYFNSSSAVDMILGPNWNGVEDYLQIVILYTFLEPIAGTLAVALTSKGKYGTLLCWRLTSLLIIVLSGSCGYYIGGPLEMVYWITLSGLTIRLPVFVWLCNRTIGVKVSLLARMVIRVLALTIAAYVLAQLMSTITNNDTCCKLLVSAIVFSVTFFFGALTNGRIRVLIFDFLKTKLVKP